MIPLHLSAHDIALLVDAHEPQRHGGIVGAGGRVAVRTGRLVGVCRVGDPPRGHGGIVDALDQKAGSVSEPPVAAHAVELFRRDEVGEAPRDVVGVRTAQHGGSATGEWHDVERAIAHECSLCARGIRPGVDDGAGCVERDGTGGGIVEPHGVGNAG